MKDDVKRSPKSNRTMGKGKVPGKSRIHPHTKKALNAVAVNNALKNVKGASTGNGISGEDCRY